MCRKYLVANLDDFGSEKVLLSLMLKVQVTDWKIAMLDSTNIGNFCAAYDITKQSEKTL